MPGKITADNRSRAAKAPEAVQINRLIIFNAQIDEIQEFFHSPRGRYPIVLYRPAADFDMTSQGLGDGCQLTFIWHKGFAGAVNLRRFHQIDYMADPMRKQAAEIVPGVSGMLCTWITSGHKPFGYHPIGLIERNRWVVVASQVHFSF